MLHYLRSIRRNLMEQNKVRTYLLYAIGEILLVVIGILIAVQVSNWNDLRKLDQEEQYLLTELKKEFSTNLALIQRDYRGNKGTSDALLNMLELFDNPSSDVEQSLDSLIVAVFISTSYDPTRGVVDEIISTGKLSVIKDDSLRYLISQWPSILKDQEEDIEIRWSHFERFVLPAIIKTYPIKNSNQYFDFSFWTDTYKRVTLPKSNFQFVPAQFFTSEMEGLLYVHSLNQDFILMNDLETENYINTIINRISENQK